MLYNRDDRPVSAVALLWCDVSLVLLSILLLTPQAMYHTTTCIVTSLEVSKANVGTAADTLYSRCYIHVHESCLLNVYHPAHIV